MCYYYMELNNTAMLKKNAIKLVIGCHYVTYCSYCPIKILTTTLSQYLSVL